MISSKRWKNQMDYPPGMPVMKESLQQSRLFISSLHIIQRIANKPRFWILRWNIHCYKSNYTPPSFHQQKHFFKQFENQISRRPACKSTGEVDPYSPDVAPMNIFEKQVVPTGMHNLSKIFLPNLATIHVLSLGMNFIPKSDMLKWKNMFSNFENFRQKWTTKCFSLWKMLLELLFGIFFFRMKRVCGVRTQEYNSVNKFYVDVWWSTQHTME